MTISPTALQAIYQKVIDRNLTGFGYHYEKLKPQSWLCLDFYHRDPDYNFFIPLEAHFAPNETMLDYQEHHFVLTKFTPQKSAPWDALLRCVYRQQ